jgi:hypothetical protein
VRITRIEQGTQAGCLGTLIPFPLNDIRRQHVYPRLPPQEGTICEQLEAVHVSQLPGPTGGRKAAVHPGGHVQ